MNSMSEATFTNENGDVIAPESLKPGDLFMTSNSPGRLFRATSAWDATTNNVGGSVEAEFVRDHDGSSSMSERPMGTEELLARVRKLEQAIREHRDSKGHDRCWLTDRTLYQVLGEPIPDPEMPEREQFLAGCRAFVDGQPDPLPPEGCTRCAGAQVWDDNGTMRLCKPHVPPARNLGDA